jgi:uncharacterized membrane protein YbaN (DUF454 family)
MMGYVLGLLAVVIGVVGVYLGVFNVSDEMISLKP